MGFDRLWQGVIDTFLMVGVSSLIALAEAFQRAISWRPSLPEACNAWWPR